MLPLSLLFFDIPQRDEAYQMLSTLDYRHSPLAPLSYFNGYLWMQLFGDTILSLRILNLTCHAVSVAIGCYIFLRCTGDRLLASALFMMLCSGSQVWAMHIYNWDTGCYPFAMLCLAISLVWWHNPSRKLTFILGIASACFMLSRLPSGVVIPALCIMIVCKFQSQPFNAICQIITYIVSTSVALVALLLLIYGDFSGAEAAFSPTNIISGHGTSDIDRYIARIKTITPTLLIQSVLAIMWMAYSWVMLYLRRHRAIWLSIMGISLLATICFLYWLLPTRTAYCLTLLPFIGAWLYPLLSRLKISGNLGKPSAEGWILLLFCIAPIIGSDGFQERFMVLPTLPVALTLCYKQLRRFIWWFTGFAFFTAVGMIGVKEAYYISTGLSRTYNIYHLGNILIDKQSAAQLTEQTQVITSLQSQGKKIATDGMMHYESSLFHDIPLLRGLHDFHIGTYDKELPALSHSITHYDALLISYPMFFLPDSDMAEADTIADRNFDLYLQNSGFERTNLTSDRFTLYIRH